jgi:hypothetical protein
MSEAIISVVFILTVGGFFGAFDWIPDVIRAWRIK